MIFTRELSGLVGWMDGGEGDFEKLMNKVKNEEEKEWKKQIRKLW